jgi:hypothetical protein
VRRPPRRRPRGPAAGGAAAGARRLLRQRRRLPPEGALTLANPFARFVECGQISAYNGVVEPVDNLFLIVGKKLTVRGFIVWDSAHRKPLFTLHVAGLLREGRIRYDETVVTGIEAQFDALLACSAAARSSASSSSTSAAPERAHPLGTVAGAARAAGRWRGRDGRRSGVRAGTVARPVGRC